MEFEGEFTVPGRPEDVIVGFTDIERMARCMPGASLEGRDEEGNYIGVMTVSFGPKRLKFKGRMSCEFDIEARSGILRGRAAAGQRAARVGFETEFTVAEYLEAEDEEILSIVKITSRAELGGVIADFARTGGTAIANVLMKEFAQNLADEFAKAHTEEMSNETKPLSARKVIWSAVKSRFS